MFSTEIGREVRADGGMADITAEVQAAVSAGKLKEGVVVLFAVGSTAALSTIEFEPGLQKDFPQALERVAPRHGNYAHHETWHDDNGSGHVKATLVGPSLSVPFREGKLALGTWQQIVLINFDTQDRERKVAVQVIGV